MKSFTQTLLCAAAILLLPLCIFGQASPWGTGMVNNQNLGVLNNPNASIPSNSAYGTNAGYMDHPDTFLSSYPYDLYIPPSYDGTEPYGLVVWNNSGNNGQVQAGWIPVLDEKKLIWVGPDNVGNTIFTSIRTAACWAGVLRMQELLNIDTNRIYSSGNSGGARMAHLLAMIYPEVIKGSLPNCGGSYVRRVDQDYETHQPNSNYEYILNWTASDLTYLQQFPNRYANMTSYGDFRQGDIMNIYHNGMEADGINGKFLAIGGGHCASNADHFRDGLAFVEHPWIESTKEHFQNGVASVGAGLQLNNASIDQLAGYAYLEADSAGVASMKTRELLKWNDEYGAVLNTKFSLVNAGPASNSLVHYGLWDYSDSLTYCGHSSTEHSGEAAIRLQIDFSDTLPTAMLLVNNPMDSTVNDTFVTASLLEWNPSDELRVKYHLWRTELRVEFSHRLQTASQMLTGVRQLADSNRSIQVRWNEVKNGFWDSAQWQNGAWISLATETIDPGNAADRLAVDYLESIVADTAGLQRIDTSWCMAMDTTPVDSSGNNDSTTAISFSEFAGGLKLYPNPNQGRVFVEFDAAIGELNWRLFDLGGKLIEKRKLSGRHREAIPFEHRAGFYLLELDDDKGDRIYLRLLRE